MKREIKFRAWDWKAMKMIPWEDLHHHDAINIFQNRNLDAMQFTGLYDKNGNEIYENDILCDQPRPHQLPLYVVIRNKSGLYALIEYEMGSMESQYAISPCDEVLTNTYEQLIFRDPVEFHFTAN